MSTSSRAWQCCGGCRDSSPWAIESPRVRPAPLPRVKQTESEVNRRFQSIQHHFQQQIELSNLVDLYMHAFFSSILNEKAMPLVHEVRFRKFIYVNWVIDQLKISCLLFSKNLMPLFKVGPEYLSNVFVETTFDARQPLVAILMKQGPKIVH